MLCTPVTWFLMLEGWDTPETVISWAYFLHETSKLAKYIALLKTLQHSDSDLQMYLFYTHCSVIANSMHFSAVVLVSCVTWSLEDGICDWQHHNLPCCIVYIYILSQQWKEAPMFNSHCYNTFTQLKSISNIF